MISPNTSTSSAKPKYLTLNWSIPTPPFSPFKVGSLVKGKARRGHV